MRTKKARLSLAFIVFSFSFPLSFFITRYMAIGKLGRRFAFGAGVENPSLVDGKLIDTWVDRVSPIFTRSGEPETKVCRRVIHAV